MKNPDIFFPEKNAVQAANEAIAMCFRCPVRPECKAYKLRSGTQYGIWAGEFSKRGEK